MQQKNNEEFAYTYSGREQAEIRKIREKYAERSETEDKMARLRRLDASVTKKAQMVSIILGVVGTLIMGIGMSLVMTDLGELLGLSDALIFPLGIVIGLGGCIPVALAYPLYHVIVRHERARIAPEILRLTDELMK